ncbi:MAG: hypothetical protein B7Y90_10665 [Alphaproteobacteria bacterium 32-64-14]|nr:MAG: hypothetical protein B7Y90_10665 [Alphaproteobacteria bacterium 32-64-14]
MKIKATAVPDSIRMISAERLREFREFTGSDAHGVTLHQHSTCVSGGFMPLVALTEIALRNCVNEAMARHLGVQDWLLMQPLPAVLKPEEVHRVNKGIRDAQRAMYAKLTNQEKVALDTLAFPNGVPANITHDQRVKRRQQKITVTQGKVIAQLTIYFWKRLFSADYDSSLWRPALKKVFPDKRIKRADVAECLERIYVLRNRIAHHEVILTRHLAGVTEAFMFVGLNLRPVNATDHDALADLLLHHMLAAGKHVTTMGKFIDRTTRPKWFNWFG